MCRVKTHNKAMNVRALCALDLATLGPLWQRYGDNGGSD
jgi:hypothetical protein